MPRTRDSFFIILLIILTLLNVLDFTSDYQEEDHNRLHLLMEGLIIVLSLLGISFLIREIQQRRREVDNLRGQLKITRNDLSALNTNLDALNNKLGQASRQYGEVIQEQLTTWDFTPSEKEVALLLLKGLSFDEIAGMRDTKEKTVRQQATAIYRKSGLNGRHEFAAWFFEDFLQ
ncbi:helix-turn-helix transcriptional regulator [Thiothrix litoralis]|jgi:DNA-binding CsgD family transcriptional regulator|uniref:Helix-turn-helix transcriptional regulator n=1 Tax=Thiothrix litoralis TaxID=2891210 RepID=A0ABX7WXK9_9GAMM|nr:helix-turn-helix transcriptional regulator [Thiothrix litoralis]QTR46349.1 helix-turn-helix transcriptional regulator [Thiothrix litoralis]